MGQIDCLETEARDATFSARVKESSGINFDRCYQCLTCTLGCPFCFAMDFSPNQVLRMVQLGLKDRVLRSSAIWFCASCKACYTRCPHDVDIPRMMDALRQMALEAGVESKETSIPQLHRTFLHSIEQWGRQYELGTLLKLKLKTKDFFGDLVLGLKMLWKGKMPLLPPKKKGGDKLRDIFEKR
ncbi:MAG: 4Fe-4S dicluster domain-containing protein [Chloroflexi bacterium]|nr:4Fe-4S dicluster domain-containing protein [Chloroflexota bacterium]